jgi:hypothetical protein
MGKKRLRNTALEHHPSGAHACNLMLNLLQCLSVAEFAVELEMFLLQKGY